MNSTCGTESTVNDGTQELRLEEKIFEARSMDPSVVATPISASRRKKDVRTRGHWSKSHQLD